MVKTTSTREATFARLLITSAALLRVSPNHGDAETRLEIAWQNAKAQNGFGSLTPPLNVSDIPKRRTSIIQ